MTPSPSIAVLVLAAVVLGCGSPTPSRRLPRERIELDLPSFGLSGLATDGEGTLWAVAERDRLVAVVGSRGVERTVPLRGVPEECDTESMTWLGGRRFALGTEAHGESENRDIIVLAELREGPEGEEMRAYGEVSLDYDQLGAQAADNDGIEGLCQVDGLLIASLEHVQEGAEGERMAAFGVHRLGGEGWWPFRVRLTSAFGTISALSCEALPGGGVRVTALERGLGPATFLGARPWTTRVLSFPLPSEAGVVLEAPTIIANLDGEIDERPNLEGLEVVGRDLWLIVDNHYGRVTGPNLAFRFPGIVPR